MTAPPPRRPWWKRKRTCLGIIALSPLAGGAMTVFALAALERFSPGGPARFFATFQVNALLGAAGSAVAALALPLRYWLRIAAAAGVAIAAYLVAFPALRAAHFVLHGLLGIGPPM